MSRLGRLAAVVAIILGGALASPRGVAAHALLQSSDPAAGSTVAAAPAIVTLTFGEQPDPKLSSVRILDTSGRDVAAGTATAVPDKPLVLTIALGAVPEGVYTVAWRTVSVVDGHTTAGSFAFGVGVPAGVAGPTSTSTFSSSAAPENVIARFILLAGLLALFGAGFTGWLVRPDPPLAVRRFAGAGWVLAAIGTIAVVTLQAVDAGSNAGDYLSSSLGAWAIRRIVVIGLAGAGVWLAVALPARFARWRFPIITVAGLAGMLIEVLTGHAAASGLTSLDVGLNWLHVAAAGVWMGGLAGLVLVIRGVTTPDRVAAVRRFSRWAGFALAAIAVTGIVRAVQSVGTLDALTGTDYGRVVIAKSVLLLVLAGLGAINRFGSVPLAPWTLVPLRRVARLEIGVGAIVIVATGLLVNLAPPASYAAITSPVIAPMVASGNDFGTSVRVRLVVQPGGPGINDFTLAVSDYDTGAAVQASSVKLRFALASGTGVGDSTLTLSPANGSVYEASGGNLSLDGVWAVTAVIAAPDGTVEVPLPLATLVANQVVDRDAEPGLPTLFTAHLGPAGTLQVYLDPGTVGPNELHATFFDASGAEIPIPTATMLLRPTDGAAAIVAPRILEPGHFITEVDAVTGGLGVDVVGAAPDGTVLHAHFDLTVPS